MTLVAARMPPGLYLDTAAKLTLPLVRAIKAAGCLGVGRYTRLPGNPDKNDIDAAELQMICGEDLYCWLIQHVRGPGLWIPHEHSSSGDAVESILHAESAGYPDKAHLWVDMEALNDSTEDVLDVCLGVA